LAVHVAFADDEGLAGARDRELAVDVEVLEDVRVLQGPVAGEVAFVSKLLEASVALGDEARILVG